MTLVSALTAVGGISERRPAPRLVRGLIATPLIILWALLACALQGALCAGVARAEVSKLVANGNFASESGLGVAVDQSSGDVFVTGFISLTYKTKAGQEPEAEFHFGRSEKFDAAGKLLSPSPFAESPPFYNGAAVNPTNGDLYAANISGAIEAFDPNTGALLYSFPVPASAFNGGFSGGTQIATDSAGNVYLPNPETNEVLKYSPTGTLLETFTGSGVHALKEPLGVAVDSSGNVWVADDGDNRVEEYAPTGAFVSEFGSKGVRALALYEHERAVDVLAIVYNSVDSCRVLLPPCAHLVEYSSSGVQLADVGAGELGAVEQEFQEGKKYSMVAVDDASGRVYVTDGEKSLVWVFQPPVAPVLGRESAVEVGTSEAKLGAVVNPGGAQTSYRFEYDTRAYAEGEGSHGVSVPFPEGSVGEGFSARTVWASAKGLEAGRTYHYRVVATNGVGKPVVGPDQTFTTQTAAQTACPNEQFRGGFSAALPDCRAYELVTPPNKVGFQPDPTGYKIDPFGEGGGFAGNGAASDGNRFAYVSDEVLPGAQSAGEEYLASRGASGWSSEDMVPPQPPYQDRCVTRGSAVSGVLKYSADLSKAIVVNDSETEYKAECEESEIVEAAPGEPLGVENLLLRDNSDGSYRVIDLTPPGVTPAGAKLVEASADERVVVFEDIAKLTPEASSNTMNTYEWREGVVRLLKFVLPSGAPVAGSLEGISEDGSNMFFSAGGNQYVRLNGGERTVQVDEARGGPGPGGGGSLAEDTADGSLAFFTDEASAGLTSDTVSGSGRNLYRYDVATNQLSDLTPVAHAEANLVVAGNDGSYVYFTSDGVLSGSQANQFGETAQSGKSNLYVDHDGRSTFVGLGAGGQVSANGAFLAFSSTSSLTGYENNGMPEIYLYSAASTRFECASCNPSGEAPTAGGVELTRSTHQVSNNGQVFFQTEEALLPRDTNAQRNVYEFDYASGLHLISSGTSSTAATLLDASESGDDVFFLGRQALVPQDSNQEANTIYDARMNGGFPETAVPPACTTADACRSAPVPQPSIFGEPASQTFAGAGNLASSEAKPAKAKPKSKPVKCKKGFQKRNGKCVKKPGKRAKKSAHANRRGK
jgi:hypothetical protein